MHHRSEGAAAAAAGRGQAAVSSGMIGRRYLDAGDRLSGRREPAEVVTVLTRWGPGGGPRNVLVERSDGSREVVPFPRRLRVLREGGQAC